MISTIFNRLLVVGALLAASLPGCDSGADRSVADVSSESTTGSSVGPSQLDVPESSSPEKAGRDLPPAGRVRPEESGRRSVDEVPSADLLAMRLPQDQAAEGWIRLFDGHSLFGWQGGRGADWRVEDGAIVVGAGSRSLLYTSVGWRDFELTLQFRADVRTNSGVFLRCPTTKRIPGKNCYEVNIAPPDNPYPTASIVDRLQADVSQASAPAARQWNRMEISLTGGALRVTLNGQVVTEYRDARPLARGRIGLQFNSGQIAFRDIRLRPLGFESLIDEKLSKWKRYPEMPGRFSVTDDGAIHVIGGKTQLESKARHADFTLLAEYKMEAAEMNSGIFFRSIPGDEMMGYECQVSNETVDGDRSRPADCGSGGIFRRGDARVVAGEPGRWSTIVLATRGARFASWVGGIQVSDLVDRRDPAENPRRGLRLAPGTIMIQGHDPTTDVLYRQLALASED